MLEDLRRTLLEGQRRSKQGSYMRRNPAQEAVPFLLNARSGLRRYVADKENDVQAWRLLSQAEECLLNYAAAKGCLERAISLSAPRDKKDLKRLALLKEYERQWTDLCLTPQQLENLGRYLRTSLAANGCEHTLRFTTEWLRANGLGTSKGIIAAVRNQGGYCDCEVLNNVVIT